VVVIQRTLGRFGANLDLLTLREEDMNKNRSNRGKSEAVEYSKCCW
jgi:hypothetical protein